MKLKKTNQLRTPSALRSIRRRHPYPRPVYPDPDEEDTPYEPRIDDDSLLYLIQDAHRRPIRHVRIVENENGDKGEERVEGKNNRLIVGGVLLLDFLATLTLFIKHVFLVRFLFRRNQGYDGQ
ncbi:hypothetical protein Moror_8660 [Moniliophthora roreri MCA 2997]|uniref:Uncharacterized protein n=2 Tax=Moniliophthora roreri TaxID=221103 RepID=V2YD22_MONRO|nr:hypothetical protein Moror_8660 [Moniliophthora roreri MCA 2997]KAI3611421.1 hypothetical protein WG66_002225 [Moniliophthora roreri]